MDKKNNISKPGDDKKAPLPDSLLIEYLLLLDVCRKALPLLPLLEPVKKPD